MTVTLAELPGSAGVFEEVDLGACADAACEFATSLSSLGYRKQIVKRLLGSQMTL
ncbi:MULTISPECIES: hypothetical protein [Bradyrhizobium]|uniref:hypothetical protein n=1 Tax=Bradyrhizobium TaxID=374 RepID=UPI0012F755C9|nr:MULTISPECIES: hypothetical protein [unclassified Bradyrhizobium]